MVGSCRRSTRGCRHAVRLTRYRQFTFSNQQCEIRAVWIRVNSDIRLIVHRSEASLLLCYVGHHDKAYDWAEKRKLETVIKPAEEGSDSQPRPPKAFVTS